MPRGFVYVLELKTNSNKITWKQQRQNRNVG